MKKYIFTLTMAVSLIAGTTQAQTTTPHKQYNYSYDANGNRIERDMQVVMLAPKTTDPTAITTLPDGVTQEEVAAGATLAAEGLTLNAYPNPATQQVTVNLNGTAETTVTEARLYSSTGSVHTSLQEPGNNFSVSLEGLAAGNYILWLKLSNGEIQRVRVVKL
jgi:YD repeat-containing protein